MHRRTLILFLALASTSIQLFARASDFPKPKSPEDVSDYGQHLQRTMTLLATSTPERRNKVRILFYGQSITVQKWWKAVEKDLRERFPHADLVCENRALGGFASQLLVRTAEYDLYPFYPDLLIFHVYGDHRRYEDIIRRTRERTTAEILIQTDHVTKEIEDGWTKTMNYTFLPQYAEKYGCQLAHIRESWKRYLKENNLKPQQLLRDNVHLNEHGEFLMADLVKQELVYRPELPHDEWKDVVKTYMVGDDVKWDGHELVMEFVGNRVDVIAAEGDRNSAHVFIDGKKPSEFPECYYHSRPSGTAGVGWPAIKRISSAKPPILEEWTAVFEDFNDKQDEFRFTVTGSKTGLDGSGSAKEKFISNSGRVLIEAEDWVFEYCRSVSKKRTPDGFTVRWEVKPLFVDVYQPPEVKDPSREYSVALAQGLENGRHTVRLVGRAAIKAIRVYKPPVR